MSKDNNSSNNYVAATVVTVAALGAGALLSYLLSDDTNNRHEHKSGSGSGGGSRSGSESKNRPLPLPASKAPNVSHNERRNQARTQAEECAVCLVDIRRYSSKILACRHRIHQRCWDRMVANNMTCPACSDNVFRM